jgi:ATP-dependent RNA helicase DeaD
MSDVSVAEAQPGPVESPSTPASFDDFPIASEVREALREMGFEKPTDVQSAVITAGVAGRDMLVQSKTGSGKTSAFGIPTVERLGAQAANPGKPHALILLPTRELAHQVAAELRNLAAKKGTRVLAVYGGVPMGRQVSALKAGVDIVVGTPGRLLDHIRRKNLGLDECRVVVLDEADEMLSMGFWDDVTELLKLSPATRQTMLFSATLPYEVAKAASQFLQDPVKIDVSGDELTVDGIDNCIIHVLPELPKPRQMLYALEGARADSAIIFCNTRNETEMLAKYLTQSGFVAEPLSGNFKQKDRERVMARIKGGELRYMVATDIAARGIDINDLSHVFNYSLPEFSEVYLHRVGRTGRIGKTGKAISLVDGKGLGTLSQLEREFGVKFTEMTFPPEEDVIRARSERIMKELAEKASVAELGQHLPVAQDIIAGQDGPQVVAFLLKAYFNGQADQARRASQAAQGPDQDEGQAPREGRRGGGRRDGGGEPREARGEGGRGEGGRGEGARGEGGDEGGRRRRRRRRGRGRGDRPGGGGGGSGGEAGRGGSGYDVVDARDMLAGDVATPAGPVSSDSTVGGGASSQVPAAPASAGGGAEPVQHQDGLTRIRVNIGFDDGFKGRGAVAKKISALAGLNEGIVTEVEARRDHAVLKAAPEIAELVLERVDGAQLGKKVISVNISN